MKFASPEWFLLLPALLAVGWYWKSLRLHKPLRIACLLTLVVLLAQPQFRRFADGLDLWVLVDQSDSAKEQMEPRLPEWESILEKSRGSADRLHFVDYAGESVKRGAQLSSGPGGTLYSGPRSTTRLHSAVLYTLNQLQGDRASRLLVLSDGYSTEPLEGLTERLLRSDVPLDYRLTTAPAGADYRVAGFRLPSRVQLNEAFLAELVVLGTEDATIPVEIFRNEQSIGKREVEITNGIGRLRFTDRLGISGSFQYEVRLLPAQGDAYPGNNTGRQWVEVQSGPRVILVTAYQEDPLANVLRSQGFNVEVVSEPSSLSVGVLSGAKVVVLNNVPSYHTNSDFVRALDFYVNHQGGGLAMIGGKQSFAAGGWFGSPIEPLLPVSMELKQEHRKLTVAMAIVMDRSGSMSMTVPGSSLQKMDLANEGAARAIGLLGDNDMVTVFAVDSDPHKVSPLVAVAGNRGSLQNAARRVQSMGGGIFVYQGLKAAWKELKTAPVGQRHIILFADAMDAEEPGEYKALLEEMSKAKTTVSVIGLGTDKDADADFLKDVAKRGNGRIFFNANPSELPGLFAQETVTVARSAFIEEAVEVKGTPGWMEMAAGVMEWLPKVDGYNLSYLRPGATQAAVSGDEYAAPLVAFWQRGAGRVAAVSFPLGGDFSQLTRGWKDYGGFIQSLTRWTMGENVPPGIGLRTSLEGTELITDLFFDADWNDRINQSPPELILADGTEGEPQKVEWERMAPGHFRASVPLDKVREYARGAVKIGNTAFPFGPINTITDAEWSFDKTRLHELQTVSIRSGGSERTDLSDVWHAPRPPAWRGIENWLLGVLLVLLVLEAWQTRTGWPKRR